MPDKDYKISAEERAEIFLQMSRQGKQIFSANPDAEKEGFKELIRLRENVEGFGEAYNFNLDILYLARHKGMFGLLDNTEYCTSNFGCEWLAPYFTYCHHVAVAVYIEKFCQNDYELFQQEAHREKFVEVWSGNIGGRTIEHKGLFHSLVQEALYDRKLSVSGKNFETTDIVRLFEKFYSMVGDNIRKHQPLKSMLKEKDDRWNVKMWDGKEYTMLKSSSVDELLSKHGFKYRIEESLKQTPPETNGRSYLDIEMEEKRIVREILPAQIGRKAMTKDSYHKAIQRIAQIGTLFCHDIIALTMQVRPDRILQDKHWNAEVQPKTCLEHSTYEIMEIYAYITEDAIARYPFLEEYEEDRIVSIRKCLTIFKQLRDFGIKEDG